MKTSKSSPGAQSIDLTPPDVSTLKAGDLFCAIDAGGHILVCQVFRKREDDGVVESVVVNGAWTAHFGPDGEAVATPAKVIFTRQVAAHDLVAEHPTLDRIKALGEYVSRRYVHPEPVPNLGAGSLGP
jgi:hypothetical protein